MSLEEEVDMQSTETISSEQKISGLHLSSDTKIIEPPYSTVTSSNCCKNGPSSTITRLHDDLGSVQIEQQVKVFSTIPSLMTIPGAILNSLRCGTHTQAQLASMATSTKTMPPAVLLRRGSNTQAQLASMATSTKTMPPAVLLRRGSNIQAQLASMMTLTKTMPPAVLLRRGSNTQAQLASKATSTRTILPKRTIFETQNEQTRHFSNTSTLVASQQPLTIPRIQVKPISLLRTNVVQPLAVSSFDPNGQEKWDLPTSSHLEPVPLNVMKTFALLLKNRPKQAEKVLITSSKENCPIKQKVNYFHNCLVCLKMFSSLQALEQHEQLCHAKNISQKPKSSTAMPDVITISDGDSQYKDSGRSFGKLQGPALSYKTIESHPGIEISKEKSCDKKYLCLVCNETFYTASKIRSHKQKHLEIYNCDTCEKSFTLKWQLNYHIKTHLQIKIYHCNLCNYSTQFSKRFAYHKKNKHIRDKVKCEVCGESFPSLKLLKAHIKVNDKCKFKCPDCDKLFLSKHMIQYRHSHKEKGCQCEMCGRIFTNSQGLRMHLKRFHYGENQFPCEFCGKIVSTSGSLIAHRRIHTGEKPFSCDICKKTFSRKMYLIVHMRTHTGVKPFKCKKCDKSFTQRGTLTIHDRYHTGIRPFACEICSKGFVTKTLCVLHEKSHNK